MAQPHPPPGPNRSQSTTSLARLYNGSGPNPVTANEEDLNDPRLDFCNSFWGPGGKGYEVLMARLRGAGRTIEELRIFWKERAGIEDDYARRLAKLAKTTLGKDEIGDLASSLQNVLNETAQQASYHSALATELKQSVEGPTAEFGVRLGNLKKGLQGRVEKSFKNKGLQEGHVNKAKERYESDCLKLNSYTANSSLVQGKELDKIQQKLGKIHQTIGANEQDFRQFVRVLEGTSQKWESEWKSFCDHVQDLEEDRLALTKDIVWAYANAVSQVCVEDDSSCERIREKLEQFEPQGDMVTFVRGWGTGDSIPDPPRFINYSAGESYPTQPTYHHANFRRISSKPPVSNSDHVQPPEREAEIPPPPAQTDLRDTPEPDLSGLNITSELPVESPEPADKPFGGVALPGMVAPATPRQELPDRRSSMPPPPVPPQSMAMPEPRVPSRQGPPTPSRDINDEDDPMARALANLRREPPPPDSVRRNPSHRRADSIYSNQGSVRGSTMGGIKSTSSPGPVAFSQNSLRGAPSPAPGVHNPHRASYQQQSASRGSIDMGLSPPPGGHTAAALAKSMDEFHKQSARDNRQSVNYSNFADDIVGAHPSSRPASPSGQPANRAPSPAMMQPPRQPPSPVADEVLSQYHQAFPGERSRSRAGSINSRRSRANSMVSQVPQQQQLQQQPPPSPSATREGFAGIGARGRSPSPQPPVFRSPSPSPVVHQGSLGPQNIGISLDEKGGVSHDSMAEAYRRQYQESQQQQPSAGPGGPGGSGGPGGPGYGGMYDQQQQYGRQSSLGHGSIQNQVQGQSAGYGQPPKSPVGSGFSRPVTGFGSQSYNAPLQQQQQPPSAYGQTPQSQNYGQQPPPQQQQQYFPSYSQVNQPPQPSQSPYPQNPMSPVQPQNYRNQAQSGYPQQGQQQGYPYQQQQQPPHLAQHQSSYGVPTNQYARSASPAPVQQPPPQQQNYGGYRAPSPQPGYAQQPQHQQQQQAQQQQRGRSPSPQPGQVPTNAAPTGQWSTTGQPVLFYVKALYDYAAQSGAEFDFQAGDIISVTSTPEDGWWSGELLDEARRVPGRTDFPSNFVCLF